MHGQHALESLEASCDSRPQDGAPLPKRLSSAGIEPLDGLCAGLQQLNDRH
jgi:hypothetical protein